MPAVEKFKEYEFRKWFNPSWLYISFQINPELSFQIVEPATDQLLTWFLENDKVSLYRRKKFGFSKSSMSFIAEMRKNLQQLAVFSVMQFRQPIFQLWYISFWINFKFADLPSQSALTILVLETWVVFWPWKKPV